MPSEVPAVDALSVAGAPEAEAPGVAAKAPAPWPPRMAALPTAIAMRIAAPAAKPRRCDRRDAITDPL